jgi:hypothetical protein
VHDNVILGGPIWWLAVSGLIVSWLLAGFVAVHASLPRRSSRFAELPESRWVYIAPSALYFVTVAVAQFAGIGALAIAIILAAPFVIAIGMVYLLRVVFPGPSAEE